MAYSADSKPTDLTALTSLASDDNILVGDTSDASEVVKAITKANLVTDLGSDFAAASHTHTHADITDYDTELAGKTNTTAFTPTADYHVATKKYVDDNAGGATQLSSLSDVNTSTPTNRNVLVADGVDFESRALVEADISDLGTYIETLEGTALLSTGETGGAKFLREDGDGTCSWQAIPGGGDALTASPLSQFAATTSAQLAGVLSDETGSGAAVFANSPTLVTPALGTPSALVGTNITGTAAGLTAGNVTTNANLTGHITSTGNAAVLGSFTVAQLSTALSDATISGNNTGDEAAASTTVAGVVELATGAETNTGTDATRAVTPDGLDDWTGSAQVTTVGTLSAGNVDAVVSAASTTTAGKVELATTAEVTTGTATTLAITPDALTGADIELADLQINGEIYADAEVDDGNSSTADTIDWTTGNFHKSTMTGNCTYTFTAPSGPARVQLMLVQDATGSRTATWPATVKWPGGTAPTLSTAASSIDIITFYYDGTNYYGVDTLDFS